jgi:hypothetical protein
LCPSAGSAPDHAVAIGVDRGEQRVDLARAADVFVAEPLVRFLDLVSGFDGHELCASGISASQQWVRGVTYGANSSDWYTAHAVQQSLHPNALGHSKIAGCVTEFVDRSYREGTCKIGDDGNLHSHIHP